MIRAALEQLVEIVGLRVTVTTVSGVDLSGVLSLAPGGSLYWILLTDVQPNQDVHRHRVRLAMVEAVTRVVVA